MHCKNVRQSSLYASYMEHIGWKVESFGSSQGKIEKWNAFVKQFPFIGSFIKIQRIKPPIPFGEIEEIAKKYRAFRVVIELSKESRIKNQESRKFGYKESKTIYSPSKTIHIDLNPSGDKIFAQFAEAKRRGVRRAMKNKIAIEETDDIEQFIHLKQKQDFLFGILIRNDLRNLWQVFAPRNVVLLFAYVKGRTLSRVRPCLIPVAGVFMLIYNQVAYYWQAAATREGKKLFAPTLLVWQALKLAKKKGCKIFDFEGIYDDRFSNATKNWQGFTRFKKGFGGQEISYPSPLVWKRFL